MGIFNLLRHDRTASRDTRAAIRDVRKGRDANRAIAKLRGYDLEEPEVRARVLAALVGEEQGEILDHVGLGPIAGAATKQVAKRELPGRQVTG